VVGIDGPATTLEKSFTYSSTYFVARSTMAGGFGCARAAPDSRAAKIIRATTAIPQPLFTRQFCHGAVT